jgi:nucleotide-binding universal stress UspA family protein
MFRRILLPLDGSPAAEAALDLILPMARALGAHVDLLHVIPDRKSLARMGPEDPLDWRMSCRRAAEYLAGIQRRFAEAGVTAETRVEEGGPAAVIVNLLREGRHELVALAPHGMGGRDTLAMGATSGAIILHAPASLLLVPPGDRDRVPSRILVPVDGSPRSEWAVSLAFHLGERLGAEVRLVHALVSSGRFGGLPQDPECAEASRRLAEANRSAAHRYMAEAQSRNAPGEAGVAGKVLEGTDDAVAAILGEARQMDADLVVLSAHGREGSLGSSLGSVPLRFLLTASVPTLVMQDHPGAASATNLMTPTGTVRSDARHSNR